MLDQIKDQISQITATDFQALRMWITAEEKPRRESVDARSEGQTEVVADLRERGVIESPAIPEDPADPDTYPAWENPGTDHSRMYLLGDRVCHDGRIWESGVDMLNSWEPGSAHTVWVDITDTLTRDDETGDPIETPQPDPVPVPDAPEHTPEIPAWRSGLNLTTGDLVTHGGQTWRVKIDHQSHAGWVPGPATHAVFEQA